MSDTFEEQALRSIDILQKQVEQEKIRRMQLENDSNQMSGFSSTKNNDIVEYQLDLKEELDKIHHLLSGHQLIIDKEGNEIWAEPEDDRLKIFSEYGVKQIMNIISFYINRNTLLSNYDEETIKWKVRDFAIELADLIFMRYEVFFHYPTPEQLYDLYYEAVRERYPSISNEELYVKCIQWSKEELQSKIRHYPMLCLSLIDSVHSTFLRALNGEERESLRKIMHVSQTANQSPDQMLNRRPFSLVRPSTWGKPK